MFERPGKQSPNGALRKGVRHHHLPFSGLCMELPLIFFYKKKKKKKKKEIHIVHI